jgi:hypothetical protein
MDWYKIISNRTPVRTKDSATFGYVAGQYKDKLQQGHEISVVIMKISHLLQYLTPSL